MEHVPRGGMLRAMLRATTAGVTMLGDDGVVGEEPSFDTFAAVARVPMRLVTVDELLHAVKNR